jgi:hypothetical protein
VSSESPTAVPATPLQWRVLSYVPLGLGAAALLTGLWGLIFQRFSDAEILASLVDTWEASALASLVLVVLEGAAVVISLGLAWVARAGGRSGGRRFIIAAVLFLGAIACTLVSQYLLTARAEQLTGQSLGWL